MNSLAVCDALGDLYYSTLGPTRWTTKTGWSTAAAGTPTDYCSFWTYAYAPCTQSGILTSLFLEYNNLWGSIPASVGGLTTLKALGLGTGALGDLGIGVPRSTLPDALGSLTNLQFLDLSYALLGGTIPLSLASLSSLTYLGLASSGLCGSDPIPFNNYVPNDGPLPACPSPPPPSPSPPPAPSPPPPSPRPPGPPFPPPPPPTPPSPPRPPVPPADWAGRPFTCCSGQPSCANASNDPLVCNTLGDLYYSTNGSAWNGNNGWLAAASGVPTDYCTFQPYIPSFSVPYVTNISGLTGVRNCDTNGVLTSMCVSPRPRRGAAQGASSHDALRRSATSAALGGCGSRPSLLSHSSPRGGAVVF